MHNIFILIVEDEEFLQKTLQDNLVSKGYTTDTAVNGEEALEKIKKSRPDLILLDLLLPKMDGFMVLRALKTDEKTKLIPVIVLTNLGNIPEIAKALEAGATTYLVKADHTIDQVIAQVQETLKAKG